MTITDGQLETALAELDITKMILESLTNLQPEQRSRVLRAVLAYYGRPVPEGLGLQAG